MSKYDGEKHVGIAISDRICPHKTRMVEEINDRLKGDDIEREERERLPATPSPAEDRRLPHKATASSRECATSSERPKRKSLRAEGEPPTPRLNIDTFWL